MRSSIPKVLGGRRNVVIFCNRNGTKSQEPLWKGAGAGSKRYRSKRLRPPGGVEEEAACLSQGDC